MYARRNTLYSQSDYAVSSYALAKDNYRITAVDTDSQYATCATGGLWGSGHMYTCVLSRSFDMSSYEGTRIGSSTAGIGLVPGSMCLDVPR